MDETSRTGGCYCGALRYQALGRPSFKAHCLCSACQHVSGGAGNLFMLMPVDGFSYTSGTPKTFRREDIENAVTREFCATCGTHITTRRPGLDAVVLKIGTLNDPAQFGAPAAAIYAENRRAYHHLPDGIPVFEKLPQ